MRYGITALTMALLASTACARSATVESTGDVAPMPTATPATSTSLPVGTTMQVRLNNELGTERSKVGDTFTATVVSDVRASDGSVAVPSGATVRGTVTAVDDSDDVTDAAVIKLAFNELTINGQNHPFEARIEATDLKQQGDTRQETVQKAGIGAAAGAVLGAVLGDAELKNILVGAALGAAAGTAISLGAGDVEGTLPVGTVLTIQSTQQVSLR
ncbi:MAG TPA: YMGG-like glycine zipper-containing protein [Gemmatimonadaceae bacterium]|nr:YMGG-like glycine zipper-containing protein [Gemmatimonadaceae bacterium]